MSKKVIVSKDEQHQQLIPTVWRSTLAIIVEAIRSKDYSLIKSSSNIKLISNSDAKRIEKNIEDYGCELISLPEETWNTSCCQWMRGYWDALIDLYTVEEGRSDLALSVRVYEKKVGFEFEIISVHVE